MTGRGFRVSPRAEAGVIDKLGKSIIGAVLTYYLFQIGIFTAFALLAPPAEGIGSPAASLFTAHGPRFFIISTVYHAFLLFMLLLFKQDFKKVPTGVRF